ncbi:molybdate ABC transporter substrate-binding protein [Klebsiella sp. WOUb02]|uniref:molybdate ABC transporter substrate-binding protein n=1 Tax=Klebsiella sp. WOUb02 TaxID=3161071 RepID=UPI003CEF7BF5
MAVLRGHAKPDISTKRAFLNALTAARSVAYSLGGASGIYLQEVLKDNGIFHDVEAKATTIAQGFTAEQLVNGNADLAIQQMSELMVVEGVDIVGPFPDEVQQLTPFSVAIVNGCENRRIAGEFIDYLLSSRCRETYLQNGLQYR